MKSRLNGWARLVFACFVLSMAVSLNLHGDVLVTKDGRRHEGTVTDQGDSYLLVTPSGGKVSLPKSIVERVILDKDVSPRYKAMLKDANLADDAEVRKLADFAEANGLKDDREKLLQSAFALRRDKAVGNQQALRSLAAWCRDYGMENDATWCTRAADQLEFAVRFQQTGPDPDKREELAKWCLERNLHSEAGRCLADLFAARKARVTDVEDALGLAEWCASYKMIPWREQVYASAIEEAAKRGDLTGLDKLLEEFKNRSRTDRVRKACAEAAYGVRLKNAGEDALAHAELSRWCAQQGMKLEAKRAEETAIRLAPADSKVRKLLGYYYHADEKKWSKTPVLPRGACPVVSANSPLPVYLRNVRATRNRLGGSTITGQLVNPTENDYSSLVLTIKVIPKDGAGGYYLLAVPIPAVPKGESRPWEASCPLSPERFANPVRCVGYVH